MSITTKMSGQLKLTQPLAAIVVSLISSALLAACATVNTIAINSVPLTTNSISSDFGCSVNYTLHQSAQTVSATGVVIGHGFLRSQGNMSDLATALAQNGIPAVTIDFCNMKLWNAHHRRNADDMRKVADAMNFRSTVYIGFSAGALAALLASSEDETAIALVTMDLVDQGNIVAESIATMNIPVIALHGPANRCNRSNEALEKLSQYDQLSVTKIESASHCEFESPTDRVCEVFCGDRDDAFLNAVTREEVIDRIVDQVLQVTVSAADNAR